MRVRLTGPMRLMGPGQDCAHLLALLVRENEVGGWGALLLGLALLILVGLFCLLGVGLLVLLGNLLLLRRLVLRTRE